MKKMERCQASHHMKHDAGRLGGIELENCRIWIRENRENGPDGGMIHSMTLEERSSGSC